MAFTGWGTGTLYTTTQGESTTMPLVVENIRYYSSTGGPGKACRIKDAAKGSTFFFGPTSASYGLAAATFAYGRSFRGIVVLSLPEGRLEIDLL